MGEVIFLIIVIIISILIAGVLALIFSFPINLLYILFVLPFRRKKLLNKAIKEGHVINAEYVTSYGLIGYDLEKQIYEYEWNNKKYKYKCQGLPNSTPLRKELYFVKNPSKAEENQNIGTNEGIWIYVFIILLIFLSIIIYIFLSSKLNDIINNTNLFAYL